MLVDRPVDVAPDPSDLDLGLVDEPAIPGQVPHRPGRVDQQGCEPLHPPIEGDVVDLDATLGEKLFEVPVGQPVPELPAHRQQDHLGRESESSEARGHPHRRPRAASALHRATLTATVRCVNATVPSDLLGQTRVSLGSSHSGPDGRRSRSEAEQRESLAPLHLLQQLPDGEAVVLYQNLPPTRVKLRRWFADRDLRRLATSPSRGAAS